MIFLFFLKKSKISFERKKKCLSFKTLKSGFGKEHMSSKSNLSSIQEKELCNTHTIIVRTESKRDKIIQKLKFVGGLPERSINDTSWSLTRVQTMSFAALHISMIICYIVTMSKCAEISFWPSQMLDYRNPGFTIEGIKEESVYRIYDMRYALQVWVTISCVFQFLSFLITCVICSSQYPDEAVEIVLLITNVMWLLENIVCWVIYPIIYGDLVPLVSPFIYELIVGLWSFITILMISGCLIIIGFVWPGAVYIFLSWEKRKQICKKPYCC